MPCTKTNHFITILEQKLETIDKFLIKISSFKVWHFYLILTCRFLKCKNEYHHRVLRPRWLINVCHTRPVLYFHTTSDLSVPSTCNWDELLTQMASSSSLHKDFGCEPRPLGRRLGGVVWSDPPPWFFVNNIRSVKVSTQHLVTLFSHQFYVFTPNLGWVSQKLLGPVQTQRNVNVT